MASSQSRSGPAEQAGSAAHLTNVLGALAVAVTDVLAEDARERGLNQAEHAAIILVATLDGISQEDLQRRLGLSQPGTTRLIDRLVERKLLIRMSGPDRRTNALRPTAAGATEARAALASRHRLLGRLTAELSPAEQRSATVLLDRMLESLVEGGESPWRICRQCDQHGCEAGEHRCPVDEARLQLQPK